MVCKTKNENRKIKQESNISCTNIRAFVIKFPRGNDLANSLLSEPWGQPQGTTHNSQANAEIRTANRNNLTPHNVKPSTSKRNTLIGNFDFLIITSYFHIICFSPHDKTKKNNLCSFCVENTWPNL